MVLIFIENYIIFSLFIKGSNCSWYLCTYGCCWHVGWCFSNDYFIVGDSHGNNTKFTIFTTHYDDSFNF